MNTHTLHSFTRSISVETGYDVIVVGGGPSGCAAAIAAGRQGARTLLIESTGTLGGLGTSGLVPAWCPFSDKEKIIYRGIAEEIFNTMKAGMPHIDPAALDWVPIDPELLKRIYDDKVQEAGVEILFVSSLCAVEMAGEGVVDALVVSSKQGLTAFKAKVYVDATGDGDLCAWAGAPFEKGDENGGLQSATLCFALTNVDNYAYNSRSRISNMFMREHQAVKEFPLLRDMHFCNCPTGPATVGFNAGHIWDIDNTDPRSVTRGMIEGRKIAEEYLRACKHYKPDAFAGAFLVTTAPMLGVRETRRIMGDYVLCVDDYVERRSFDDEIGRNAYCVDVHRQRKNIDEVLAEGLTYWQPKYGRYDKGESHGIPYRSLLPQKLDNVIVAGRCISTDRSLQGATRVMPVCLVTGQAAGTAAAFVARDTGRFRDVDVNALRTTLKAGGAYIA